MLKINYEKYFTTLIKKAANKIQCTIGNIESNDECITFYVNGVSVYAPIVQYGNAKALRFYYDVIDVLYDVNDEETLVNAFQIMNRFNLCEGGLAQFVFLQDEEAEALRPALKTIDIVVAFDDREIKEYHLNLIADILNISNSINYIKEYYINKLNNLK